MNFKEQYEITKNDPMMKMMKEIIIKGLPEKMKDKIIIGHADNSRFYQLVKEHFDKIKDHCEAKRPCNYTDLYYCEACDLTLCSRHFK